MKKTTILLGLLFGAYLAFAENQPNMMFILADDCTFRDLELYGGPARTPNINKLAKEGMTFSRCYQAAPMCSPTRNNLYTGVYPVKSGAYPNHTFVYSDVKSIPHYLKEQGYRVALIGKTHVGPRENFPFEYFTEDFGFYGKDKQKRLEKKPYPSPRYPAFDRFIRECVESNTPFCVFAASHEPHGPYTNGDPSVYRNNDYDLPDNLVDTPKTREEYARYLAEITFFDGQVGECISMLKGHGAASNTLVMVATEQGSSFPYGKWTTFENGVASGLVARWPGKISAGSKSDAIVEYCDVVPTLLDVAHAPIPEAVEGRSFLPVLVGETTTHKDYSYSLHTTVGVNGYKEPYGTRSVVSKRYRYIRNLTPEGKFTVGPTRRIAEGKEASGYIGEWEARANDGDKNARALIDNYIHRPAEELYDIISDPYCRNNLAANPENGGILKEHAAKLDAWMKQQGDNGVQTELDAKYRCTKLEGKAWKNNERPAE